MRCMSGGTALSRGLVWAVAVFLCAALARPLAAQSASQNLPSVQPAAPAQAAGPAQSAPAQPITPAQATAPSQPPAEAPAETLHLLNGRSLVITSPGRIRRVSVADPLIVEAVGVNPNQVLLNAKAPGATSVVIWDEEGQSQTFDVIVDLDALGLAERIREAFPNETIRVEATRGIVTLAGQVSSEAVANKVLQMAEAMVPKKENVVSLLQVPSAPTQGEVLLQVKFAEVDRSALSQLGINIMSLPGNKIIGSTSTQQFAPPAIADQLSSTTGGFQLGDLLNIFVFRPDINLAATIRALATRNLLQILAEPNVLTETGKEASFLAGGEFPFPVVQPGGTSGIPVITIQFREFGVRLNFRPTIMPGGRIHLHVRPEVSALDFANALTISGFTVPALSTRRVESEMVLQDGQTFAIAGLVDNRLTEVASKIPGLGDIPILGNLFKSRSFNKSKTELLVMVTPRIAVPSPPATLPGGPEFPKQFMEPATRETRPSAGQ